MIARKDADRPVRRTRSLLVRYPRAVPVAIFALVMAITLLSVYAVERGEAETERVRMNETAQSIASALQRRGNTSTAYLRAGAAYLSIADTVEYAEFRRFVEELELGNDLFGAEGIGWARALRPADVAPFEQQMNGEVGFPLEIYPQPDGSRNLSVPVTFLLPDTTRNRRALGYDMYSEPIRRRAMNTAVNEVRPTASGRVTLIQQNAGQNAGFIIYMPVFAQVSAGRVLRGFIYSPFNSQAFLDSALELAPRGTMGVALYDGSAQDGTLVSEVAPDARTGRTQRVPVEIANRDMTLEIESARGSALSMVSMITLIFGLMVASLLMLVARLLTQQAMEDEASLRFFEQQNSIRNSLTRELNHRVKNTLANVLSIISLTRRRSNSLTEFADGLDGRIRALSATHDLLTQSDWGATPIRAVVEAEMAPYARDTDRALEIEGPDVSLAPNDALSLGLAIHELVTNAAKYGALSAPGGRVRVGWEMVDENLARVEWLERDGPPVRAPDRGERGFGTELIEKIVAHELRYPVDLQFEPEGVRCELRVPVRELGEFAIRAKQEAPAT